MKIQNWQLMIIHLWKFKHDNSSLKIQKWQLIMLTLWLKKKGIEFAFTYTECCSALFTMRMAELMQALNMKVIALEVSFKQHLESLHLDLYWERYGPFTDVCLVCPVLFPLYGLLLSWMEVDLLTWTNHWNLSLWNLGSYHSPFLLKKICPQIFSYHKIDFFLNIILFFFVLRKTQ